MTCPFAPAMHGDQQMVGVFQCGACGAYTNDPPELGHYQCRDATKECVKRMVDGVQVVVTHKPNKGWGDLLAEKLDAIGITQERWTEGLVALGLTTYEEGCNCPDRQQKLNELGEKVMAWWRGKSI